MKIVKILSPELLGADAALRRAAIKVKQEAERLGTPYVVSDRKDNVADKPVFNRTVTLRNAGRKSFKQLRNHES